MAANSDVAWMGWTSASHPVEPRAALVIDEISARAPQPAARQACVCHQRRGPASIEGTEFKARDARLTASHQLTPATGDRR
jgi:hypothetical protein